jgi:hypothetical protein
MKNNRREKKGTMRTRYSPNIVPKITTVSVGHLRVLIKSDE